MKTRNFYLLLFILAILFIAFSLFDTSFSSINIDLTSILIIVSYMLLFTGIVNNILKEHRIKRNHSRFISQHYIPQATLQIEPYSDSIIPKDIVPYEFYCSFCDETSFGYTVYCPNCERRMQQPGLEKNTQSKKITCVICYKDNCPSCERKLEGDNTCYEECPYCERIYHKHCWEKTIKTFGKCGFCLEIPPSEMVRQIFKKTSTPSKSPQKKKRYILSKPIEIGQLNKNLDSSEHLEKKEIPSSK